MVGFIDDLEAKALVERRRDPHDRRVHLLHLTAEGGTVMRKLADLGGASEEELLRSLNDSERAVLRELLSRVAADQQLAPGVHPGYRRMKPNRGHDPDCGP
jgi:DNA-binding MarR family transcriptional regulator